MKFVEIVLPEKIRIFINFVIKFCNILVYQLKQINNRKVENRKIIILKCNNKFNLIMAFKVESTTSLYGMQFKQYYLMFLICIKSLCTNDFMLVTLNHLAFLKSHYRWRQTNSQLFLFNLPKNNVKIMCKPFLAQTTKKIRNQAVNI